MTECDCLGGCPFFHDKMANMPALAGMMKKHYCLGDFMVCARHQVKEKLGKEHVPANLFPNQAARVPGILAQFHGTAPA